MHLIAVGQRPPGWVTEGFADYLRRLPREMPLRLTEIPPAIRNNTPVERVRRTEAERILAQVAPGDWVIALDVAGQPWSTRELSERMDHWRMQGRDVTFIIGGADGLDRTCLERANGTWSLSALTFPHALVRVLLAEQLYRAWSLLSGHPYHRG